jgi:hypothetical protein
MKLLVWVANEFRKVFGRKRKKTSRRDIKLTTYGSGGVFPGVDLDNTAALLDLMDGLDDPTLDPNNRYNPKMR